MPNLLFDASQEMKALGTGAHKNGGLGGGVYFGEHGSQGLFSRADRRSRVRKLAVVLKFLGCFVPNIFTMHWGCKFKFSVLAGDNIGALVFRRTMFFRQVFTIKHQSIKSSLLNSELPLPLPE